MGRQFAQRNGKVGAGCDIRIGKDQMAAPGDEIIVENEVEIDRTACVAVFCPFPAQHHFYGPQYPFLDGMRAKHGADLRDAIIVIGVVRPLFCLCLVYGGNAGDFQPPGEKLNRQSDVLFGLDVRSQSDIGLTHWTSCRRRISTPTLRAKRKAEGFSTRTSASTTRGFSRQISAAASASASTR